MLGEFAERLINLEPGSFTFAMVKPDVYPEHLDEILKIVEENFQIIIGLPVKLTPSLARALYYEHVGKDFYEKNLEFIQSGEVFAMVLEGPDAVLKWRSLIGPACSAKAHPETIRGRFGNPEVTHENGVHGSDSPLSALRESLLFFGDL